MSAHTVRALIDMLSISLQFIRWQRTMMTCAYVAHVYPSSHNPHLNVDGIIECFIDCRESLAESVDLLNNSFAKMEQALQEECKEMLQLANDVVSSENMLMDPLLITIENPQKIISDELIIKDMLTPSVVLEDEAVREPLADVIRQYDCLQASTTCPGKDGTADQAASTMAHKVKEIFHNLVHDLKAYVMDYESLNSQTESLLVNVCGISKDRLASLADSFREYCQSNQIAGSRCKDRANDNVAGYLHDIVAMVNDLVSSKRSASLDQSSTITALKLRAILDRLTTIEQRNNTILNTLKPLG